MTRSIGRSNKGAAGVDRCTFEQIELSGREQWLGKLTEELQQKTYKADPLRRGWIAKANGKQRPLSIPTIRDRVVQMATVLVREPIAGLAAGTIRLPPWSQCA